MCKFIVEREPTHSQKQNQTNTCANDIRSAENGWKCVVKKNLSITAERPNAESLNEIIYSVEALLLVVNFFVDIFHFVFEGTLGIYASDDVETNKFINIVDLISICQRVSCTVSSPVLFSAHLRLPLQSPPTMRPVVLSLVAVAVVQIKTTL